MHVCTVSSGYGHIIYLFTHLLSHPAGRAHAAEVPSGEDSANTAAVAASMEFACHMQDGNGAQAMLPEHRAPPHTRTSQCGFARATVAFQEIPNRFSDFQDFHDFQDSGFVKV